MWDGCANKDLSPLEILEQKDILEYNKIPDEYYRFILVEAKKQIISLGEKPPIYTAIRDRPGLMKHMNETAEKIAEEIDLRHRKVPLKSNAGYIVKNEEIKSMIEKATKDNPSYDDDARLMLVFKVRYEIRKRDMNFSGS